MDMVLDATLDEFYDAQYSFWYMDTFLTSSIEEQQAVLIVGLLVVCFFTLYLLCLLLVFVMGISFRMIKF